LQYSKQETLKVIWYEQMVIFYHYRWALRLFVWIMVASGLAFIYWGLGHLLNWVPLFALIFIAIFTPILSMYRKSVKLLSDALVLIRIAYKQTDINQYHEACEKLRKGWKLFGVSMLLIALILSLIYFSIWHFINNFSIDYNFLGLSLVINLHTF
jgi:hypothetical protein